jgi:hypothetical protein
VAQHGRWKNKKAFVDRVYHAWAQRRRRKDLQNSKRT